MAVGCHIPGALGDNSYILNRRTAAASHGMKQHPVARKISSGIESCGLIRRLAIMIYDGLIVLALCMIAAGVALLAGFRGLVALRDPLYTVYLISVWFAYLGWCWHYGGMTVGMRAWKVRIESDDGTPPSWAQCLARFVLSLLSAAALGIGFAWSLLDEQKRAWHDLASRTRLLRWEQHSDGTA
jgi:uncharacterized RDD family membrane protein YckC